MKFQNFKAILNSCFKSYDYLLGKSLLDIQDLDLDDYVMIHVNFPNAIIYRKDDDVHFCLTEEEFSLLKRIACQHYQANAL